MTEALVRIFRALPRYAPGSDDVTREALRRLGPLPPRPRVVDLGCGAGAQTLVLAAELDGPPILAVDLHRPFLEELEAAAARAGLAHRVRTRCEDFATLDAPADGFDLLWSEGAIYQLGLEAGLRRWRSLLGPGGRAVVSEVAWTTDARPAAAVAFWEAEYPAMTDEAGNRRAVEAAGWLVDDAFTVPRSAWEAYYGPLSARLAALRPQAEGDAALHAAITDVQREIDVWAAHGHAYGYVCWLVRPR